MVIIAISHFSFFQAPFFIQFPKLTLPYHFIYISTLASESPPLIPYLELQCPRQSRHLPRTFSTHPPTCAPRLRPRPPHHRQRHHHLRALHCRRPGSRPIFQTSSQRIRRSRPAQDQHRAVCPAAPNLHHLRGCHAERILHRRAARHSPRQRHHRRTRQGLRRRHS